MCTDGSCETPTQKINEKIACGEKRINSLERRLTSIEMQLGYLAKFSPRNECDRGRKEADMKGKLGLKHNQLVRLRVEISKLNQLAMDM